MDTVPTPRPIYPLRTHHLRDALVNEVHARPTVPVAAPLRVSHLATLTGEQTADADYAHLVRLCERHGVVPPAAGITYFLADCGAFRLRWERHTEFVTFTFSAPGGDRDDPFAMPAIEAVPRDWLAGLPGEVLVAVHLALLEWPEPTESAGAAVASVGRFFVPVSLIGSRMSGGAAASFTDCRLHADGFGRILVATRGDQGPTGERQAGRLVQRLLEIETYRTLALLALPEARDAVPRLGHIERELSAITAALARQGTGGDAEREEERLLLDRLAGLAAEVERIAAATSYRFGAAAAYAALVGRRIGELREERLPGLQTFDEFMERRLQPAVRTCEAVAERQDLLSARLTRAGQLLRARVEMTLQAQNRDLLRSMDRRAALQLRLQETVEGLSVVAISYYAVALLGHVTRPVMAAWGLHGLEQAAEIALVAVVVTVVWLGMRRMRRRLH